MAKSRKRAAAMKARRVRRGQAMVGGGKSHYAKKHPGNTGPSGMWRWVTS